MEVFDHVVIGGGINGCCAAYQLGRRGAKVVLLEQFPLPHSRGSSHGQSRGIRRAYPDPFFTSLMESAYREWENIENQTGVKLIQETGLLCFSDDKNNGFINRIVDSFKKNKEARSEDLNASELRKRYPYINFGNESRACYDPTGGVIMADKALKCVQDLSVKFGVEIRDGDGVTNIIHDNQKVEIHTNSGRRYLAKSCIVCTGPWAGQLLSKLGYSVPLKPIKIPVYYWKANQFLPHTWIFEDDEKHLWGLPSLEYPGLVKICPHHGPEVNPEERDAVSTEESKQEMIQFIKKKFPGVTAEVKVEESCMYTLSPDSNPIIDTLPAASNIVIGVGFSGTGFKLGPVTGSMLADLAQGIKKRQDVPLLSLTRFGNPHL